MRIHLGTDPNSGDELRLDLTVNAYAGGICVRRDSNWSFHIKPEAARALAQALLDYAKHAEYEDEEGENEYPNSVPHVTNSNSRAL